MPAGFTHMTLSRKSLDQLTSETGFRAKILLSADLGTFLMGSLAPDLPYMGLVDDWKPDKSEFNHVADKLHIHETTAIPFAALDEARVLQHQGEEEKAQALFVFFMGYISHVVADGFTHPFIRDRVGNYGPDTEVPHRILEMKLDVLVLDHYLKIEANGVSPQSGLTHFRDQSNRNIIFESFSRNLHKFHGEDLSPHKMEQLAEGMITMLNLAEGNFFNWYRDILGVKGLAYFTLEDIRNNSKEIRTLKRAIDADAQGIPYNSLSSTDVDVIDDVFPKYFAHMPKVIEAAYAYVFENGPDFKHLVPAINLDNGRLLVSQDLKFAPALWDLYV